jgi:hypothetical protein
LQRDLSVEIMVIGENLDGCSFPGTIDGVQSAIIFNRLS